MSLSYVQRAAISIFTLLPIATGIAGTVFDQPTKLPHHVCDDCWTSDRGEDGEWRSFDDFQLPLKTVVTEVYWQGTYWHTRDESVNPVEPDTNEWEIAFFPSRTIQDRSFPDTRSNSTVYRESIFADEVDSNFLQDYEFDSPAREGETIPVYEFSMQLAEPVVLEADKDYWFSPLSVSDRLQPVFAWTVSDRVGKSVQIGARGQSGRFIYDNNFVFAIDGLNGDFNADSNLDSADVDMLIAKIVTGEQELAFDLNLDGAVNTDDLNSWVVDFKGTWFGDANLDGEFDTGDFVKVFQAGQYEDGVSMNSGWEQGDFNGDREFDTGDLVVAFQHGGFESGPRMAALSVPEPSSWLQPLLAVLLVGFGLRNPRRESQAIEQRRRTVFAYKSVATPIVFVIFCIMPCMSRAELIRHGDFESLAAGNAPNNDTPAGGWQINQDVVTINNSDGTYTDDYRYHEESEDKVSIVETSSFDPSRDGNSLRLIGTPGITIVHHLFDEPVVASPDQFLRANFDLFVTKPDRDYVGSVFFSADHGGGGRVSSWDRGPQISVRGGAIEAAECDSIHCTVQSGAKLIDGLSEGEWQRIQLDVDLESNTYDAFWAAGDSELRSVGSDLKFRAQDIVSLDRINFAFFREQLPVGAEIGELYLDNVSVEVLNKSIGNVRLVPEPQGCTLLAITCVLVLCRARGLTCLGRRNHRLRS